jgi:hypothetical protein
MPLGFIDEIVTVVSYFYRLGDWISCESDWVRDLKNPVRKLTAV